MAVIAPPSKPARRNRALVGTFAAGVVLLIGAITVVALARPSANGERKGAGTADLVPVAKLSFEMTTTTTGDLQAKKQIEIRSELDSESTIVELVPEGTAVKKGDLLIKLNGDALTTQIQEEELRVISAQNDVKSAEDAVHVQEIDNASKLRQADLKVELAKLALDQWLRGEHEQKKNDIKLALERADRELTRLTEKAKLSKELYARKFLSKDEMDRDELARIEAEAALTKAKLDEETYEKYQHPKDQKSKTSDVTEAEAELERVKGQNSIQLGTKVADLDSKRRQLANRQEKFDKLKKQLENCTIVAPSDGLVVYAGSIGGDFMIFNGNGPLQIGRRVFPNESLIVLPDTSEMIAQVKVHESLAGRVKPGQPAAIKIDAVNGQSFRGMVESMGVLAESSNWRDPNRREYSVKIAIENDSGLPLKPSMRCEAVITLGSVEDALAVPIQAVFAEDVVRFVYVPRGSKYARVPVQIGRRSDIYAEVSVGLTEGQRVLIREPSPTEVLESGWDKSQLELVGFKLGEDGKPIATKPQGDDRQGGPGGRGGRRGGKPGEPGTPGQAVIEGEKPADATKGADGQDTTAETPAGETADAQPVKADDTPAQPAAEAPAKPDSGK